MLCKLPGMRIKPGTSKIHAETFARALGAVVDETPAPSSDWLMVVGMSPSDKELVDKLRADGQKVVAYWIGSDSMCAVQNEEFRKNIPECDVHIAVHERIADELSAWGIKAGVVYPCARTPSAGLGICESPLVGVYMPEPELYMLDECVEVANDNPALPFVFYGAEGYDGLPANVKDGGRMTPEEVGGLSDKISVMLRLCKHDGFPVGGIEMKMRNRHVIENFPYPGFLYAETTSRRWSMWSTTPMNPTGRLRSSRTPVRLPNFGMTSTTCGVFGREPRITKRKRPRN